MAEQVAWNASEKSLDSEISSSNYDNVFKTSPTFWLMMGARLQTQH